MSFGLSKGRIGTTMNSAITPRQNIDDGDLTFNDAQDVPFWWTKTGVIVKWSIFLGFTVLIIAYLTIGFVHVRRRARKGLAPLAYHRFLLPRAELARLDPRYAYPRDATYTNYHPGYYGMQAMPPPPVYDPNRPPQYEGVGAAAGAGAPAGPPSAAAKINPEQGAYAPPPGPPPSQGLRPQGTGASSNNPFADPERR